jgi:hypothetical protein
MIVSYGCLRSDKFWSSFENTEGRIKFCPAASTLRFILIIRNLNSLCEINRKRDLVPFSVKLYPRGENWNENVRQGACVPYWILLAFLTVWIPKVD